MKNIFKFMGIALLASSMIFVSCKKDDTTPTDNSNNNTPTIADGTTVNFGGAIWTSNTATAIVADGHVQISAYQTQGQFPGIQVRSNAQEGIVEGTVTEDDDYNLIWTPEQNIAYVYYYATKEVDNLSDWLPLDYKINITKYDATNFKLTAEVTAQMFNYDSFYEDEVDHITDAAKKTLTATFGNITLQAAN